MTDLELEAGCLKRQTLSAAVSVAWDNLRATKRRMDEAPAVLDRAEDEWHKACLEHDRLEAEEQTAYSSSAKDSKP